MSAHEAVLRLKELASQSIIVQNYVLERPLLFLFCNGNALVEQLSGLPKTRTVKAH